jgi:ELWxxDGT repeat protein
LWRTDGTPAGTTLVKDIRPGTGSSIPRWMQVVGGRMYFQADDGVTGIELWTTDGTEGGTIRVADINPGAGGSTPWRFYDVNGAVMIFASDGVNPPALFRFEPETVKPTASSPRFLGAAAKPAVSVDFDEDVSSSLAPGDLVLTNLTTGQTVESAAIALAYDAAGNRATFTFPGLPGGVLPDGNYHVSMATDVVRDTSNNPLAGDVAFDFYVLGADANHDRVVNFDDLLILAKSYNKVLELPPPPPPAALVTTSVSASILPSSPSWQDRDAKSIFSTKPVAKPAPAKAKPVAKPARRA